MSAFLRAARARLDLPDHLLDRHDLLLAHLAAADRRLLVLDEDGGHAQLLVPADGAGDVLDVPEPVAGVHQHRQRRGRDDLPDRLVLLVELDEVDVGEGVPRPGEGEPADLVRLEPGPRDQPGGQGVGTAPVRAGSVTPRRRFQSW